MTRAPAQTVPPLHTNTASSSAQTGIAPRTAPTNMLCKNAAPSVQRAQLDRGVGSWQRRARLGCSALSLPSPSRHSALHQAQNPARHDAKLCSHHNLLRVNHQIPSRTDLFAMQPHNLTHTSPDTIAHHGPADLLFDAESESAVRHLVDSKKS